MLSHTTHSEKNDLTKNELAYLQSFLKLNPAVPGQKIKKNDQLSHDIYVFGNKFVIKCAPIGQGFFGKVKMAKAYKFDAQQNLIPDGLCVIKTKKDLPVHYLEDLLSVDVKMRQECAANKKMFGRAKCAFIETNTKTQGKRPQILLPYLGDMQLSKFANRADLVQALPIDEYFKLFITYAKQLNTLHKKVKRLHKDVRPENLLLSVACHDNQYSFSDINLIDLGNIQKKNEKGVFGDPKYQPYESFLTPFFASFNNEKIDISSLARTLTCVVTAIKNHHLDKHKEIFTRCCDDLFNQMESFIPGNRPSLKRVITTLEQAREYYHDVQACSSKTPAKQC